jgi:hypothetical protein
VIPASLRFFILRGKEKMNNLKKILSSILLLSVIMLCFTGCESVYATSFSKYTDFEGIYITVDEIEANGLSEVLTVTWHNETDYTATFGLNYTIQFYDNEQWNNIRVIDFAILEIACILEPHSTITRSYSTEYFNTLIPGDYRIQVNFYVDNEPDYTAGTTFAPFAKGYK